MAPPSCENCGIKISNEDNFCPNCGVSTERTASDPTEEKAGDTTLSYSSAGPNLSGCNGCNLGCGALLLLLLVMYLLSSLGIVDLNECYSADDCDYGYVCETRWGYNDCIHMNDYE